MFNTAYYLSIIIFTHIGVFYCGFKIAGCCCQGSNSSGFPGWSAERISERGKYHVAPKLYPFLYPYVEYNNVGNPFYKTLLLLFK